MAENSISNLGIQQQAGYDPFASARQQQEAKMQASQPQNQMVGSPMQGESIFSGLQLQSSQFTPDQFQYKRDFNPLRAGGKISPAKERQNQEAAFAQLQATKKTAALNANQTNFSEMMKLLGVQETIPFNEMGRFQLTAQLMSRFGENYNQNPDAKMVLDTFDKELQKNPSDNARALSQSISNGERTLGALLKL